MSRKYQKHKAGPRNCKTPYCLNDAEKNRSLCAKCRNRANRLKNPHRNAYQQLKDNAKRRGIYFNLSFNEWLRFCNDTGYMELKGTGATDMTVDRKIPKLGYIYSNMQVLTNIENIKKRNKDLQNGWSTDIGPTEDVPF